MACSGLSSGIARGRRLAARSVGVFVCVTGLLALVSLPAGGGAIESEVGSLQPPPTKTPDAPGIVIASSGVYDMPDPFLLSAGGTYYLFMSSAFGDVTNSNVPVLVGTPGHWSPIHDAMPKVPSWAFPSTVQATTWDPFVTHLGDKYVMYSAPSLRVDRLGTPMHCIAVAVSDSPGGPYTPVGKAPLVCQPSLGGDIDAQLFVDPDGPRGPAHPNYLIWKSDNNNLPGSGPCTIWAAPMSNDGLRLAGAMVAIFRPTQAWEEPVLEAPQLVEAPNGSDWMFFSSGTGYYTSRYDMGFVECSGPLGGCDADDPHLLITTNAQGVGPGEETVFIGQGDSTWLLYNPWHSRIPWAPLRPAEAVRIGWAPEGGPYVAEAGSFPPPT
jgi:arabinan endo-1,5-alpha-L-arabinosidase